jgi:hypothetical protein
MISLEAGQVKIAEDRDCDVVLMAGHAEQGGFPLVFLHAGYGDNGGQSGDVNLTHTTFIARLLRAIGLRR